MDRTLQNRAENFDLISDLTCALPRENWVADDNVFSPCPPGTGGQWRMVDYVTDAYRGRMLTAGSNQVPPLRIPLARQGWHAVSIGIAARTMPAAIEVRLGPAGPWQTLFAPKMQPREEPWTIADLTGLDLEVRFPQNMHSLPWYPYRMWEDGFVASLMSVRLTPIRGEHLPIVTTKRHHRLVQMNDGHGMFWRADHAGPHIVTDALADFTGSDWDVCCLGTGGADLVMFESKYGTLIGQGGWDFPRRNDARLTRIMREMGKGERDPLKQAVDLVHSSDRECWTYIRPQGWVQAWPWDHVFRSQFYSRHPEWRCVEADGLPITQMSIAYEAVRRQLIEILREGVQRGSDGVCLALVRGWPLVRYEEPVRARFRELHGREIRDALDDDPELLMLWRDYVTQWFGEIREMLDSAGREMGGRRLKLSVICGANLEWNLRYGVDVADLARRGWLDAVLPYPYTLDKHRTAPSSEIQIEEYARALQDTGVELLPSLGYYADHDMGLAEYRRRAAHFYRGGATGLSRWDTAGYLSRVRLDDDEYNQVWCDYYLPACSLTLTEVSGIPLTSIPNCGG